MWILQAKTAYFTLRLYLKPLMVKAAVHDLFQVKGVDAGINWLPLRRFKRKL